jgi:hypothetical protein
VARENINIVEKAKRLIDLCRKRSLKHNDKAQVWLSHVCIDCELDESFIPPCAHDEKVGVCTLLPTFNNEQSRICKRKLMIECKNVFASFQRCLKDYSKVIKKTSQYDKFTDDEEWIRGLFLLAEFCSDNRMVYHDTPPLFENGPFGRASSTCSFKNMNDVISMFEEFAPQKVAKEYSVYSPTKITHDVALQLFKKDPDARWVLHWDNIFSAIELAAIENVCSVAREGKWFDDVTEQKLTADTLLKSVKRKGGLQKSTQPDGRKWLHSVYEVMEVYPAHAQPIRNALNTEI